MGISPTVSKREQSQREETANSISHGVGLVAALVGTPILIMQAARHGGPGFIVGAGVFSTTVILLYLASTLYHALPTGKAKAVFRIIEHSAIFLLIAGTYTPFTLGVLRGAWGLDAFRGCLGSCRSRGGAEGIRQGLPPDTLHRPLSVDGVGYRNRGRSVVCQSPNSWLALVACRGLILQHRGSLFRDRFEAAVWPLNLASICCSRYHMPLLCRPLVCCLTRPSTAHPVRVKLRLKTSFARSIVIVL